MIDYSSDEIFDFLINEAKAHFSGWDFSYIADREAQAPLRWSYVSEALLRVRKSGVVLDMETGGGEMFSRFAPFPTKAYATEGYAPNVQLARQRLESLGVQVIQIDEEEGGPQYLPFEDQFFDLVLNRHGYYWPPELYRILRPGGVFLTQQVGDNNDVGMRQLLGAPDAVPNIDWEDLAEAVGNLKQAGFRIVKELEDIYPQRFYDVGAIVYQLKAVSWQIPDFTVEKYFERLKEIHGQIQHIGYVDVLEHRFFIIAEKVCSSGAP
jgi:SAM-dependent methyltransferase